MRAVVLVATVAAVVGLPSLGLPFLSDDWLHAEAAAEGRILTTPFRFVRPLCSITYWIDWQLWGLAPAAFHATNVVLAAACAGLLVVLLRRLTNDASLACIGGLVFALHPYHIGTVAWIAARSDLLSTLLVIAAVLAHERWWERGARRMPLATIALFASALLTKESAVVFLGLPLVLGAFNRGRWSARAEWVRIYLPLLAVSLLHFLVFRPQALGGLAVGHLKWIGAWRGNLLCYGVSAVAPVPPEYLQARPWLWGAVAGSIAGALLLANLVRARRLPVEIWGAAAAFVVLLGPSLIGFQQRYLYLASGAAALALAALLRGAGRWIGGAIAAVLVVGWTMAGVELWTGWYTAGRASERLFAGLVRAGEDPQTDEIVVVASPHRVHGVPVTTDLTRAAKAAGGRGVPIRTATEFDYPSETADAFSLHAAARRETAPEFLVGVVPGVYSRYVAPRFPEGERHMTFDWATIDREGPASATVRVVPRHGRRVLGWVRGDLVPVEGDTRSRERHGRARQLHADTATAVADVVVELPRFKRRL